MGYPREAYKYLLDKQKPMSASKYKNNPTYINNIRFASKRESIRYIALRELQKEGRIKNLKLQPRFKFPFKVSYVADFQYTENGKVIVEDVKGFATDVFKIKLKCFKYFYPDIDIRIIK